MQVGIHRHYELALRPLESDHECGTFPVVAAKSNDFDTVVPEMQISENAERIIGAPVIHENDFVAAADSDERVLQLVGEFFERLLLIVERNDDGNLDILLVLTNRRRRGSVLFNCWGRSLAFLR